MTETTNEAAAILTTTELRKRFEAATNVKVCDLSRTLQNILTAAFAEASVISSRDCEQSWLYRQIIEATEVQS